LFPIRIKAGKPGCLIPHQTESEQWTSSWFLTRPRAYNIGFKDIYTLLPALFFPRNRHPFPKEGFRRFVIRFCGSTYNTTRHLKIVTDQNPVSPPYFIARKLFFRAIKTKLPDNRFSGLFSVILLHFSRTARKSRVPPGITFFRPGISGAHFGKTAV